MNFFKRLFGRSNRPSVPQQLAEAMRRADEAEERYSQTGDVSALNETITLWKHILDDPMFPLVTQDFRLVVWNNAAVAFIRRFQAYGDTDALTKAIAFWQESISSADENFPDWASWQTNLGSALALRFETLGQVDDLNAAIDSHYRALKVAQEGTSDWIKGQTSLGNALVLRFEKFNQIDDLNTAMETYRQALKVVREGSPEWAHLQTNLGTALSRRFEAMGQVTDLDAAIAAYHKARKAAREGSPGWGSIQANLGSALVLLFEAKGQVADLEAAIEAYRQALKVVREGSPEWAHLQSNLGTALTTRFEALSQVVDLDAAIEAYHKALKTEREGSPDWASIQSNLGVALRTRFEAKGQVADLKAAIEAYYKALRAVRKGSSDWGSIQANLGGALVLRFKAMGRGADLDAAIEAYQRASEVTREGSPKWASMQAGLGTAHTSRFEATGGRIDTFGAVLHALYSPQSQVTDLDDAIAAHHRALRVTREGSPDWARWQINLGVAYRSRFMALGRKADLEAAIGAYQEALGVFSPEVYPDYTLTAALPLGRLLFYRNEKNDLEKSLSVYRLARRSDAYLYFESPDQNRRQRQLHDTQGMFANYAYALVHQGKLTEAVEAIEAGRAREMAEDLQGKRASKLEELRQHTLVKQSWRRVMEARSAYSHSGNKERATAEKRLAKARINFYSLMREMWPEFFKPMTFADIQAVARSIPLAYLFSTPAGGLALIIHGKGVAHVRLNNLKEVKLREMVTGFANDFQFDGYMGAYDRWRRNPHSQQNTRAWLDAIESTTRWLWDAAMGPLVAKLHELGYQRAVLIPGGWLGLLPLHAAWTPDESKPTGKRYALDDILFTYAPSARALLRARERAGQRPSDSLLAVRYPDPHFQLADHAIRAALDCFDEDRRLPLLMDDAYKDAVLQAFDKYAVLFFFTHGVANFEHPLDSGLLMAGDERLTLEEIMALDSQNARLAVLSACETGVSSDLDRIDEVVSLPSGMMQAGVPGVVGSLWSVAEDSTAILISLFFEQWKKHGLTPPQALRRAQQMVRDVRAHPFYWAAFTYTGW